ELGAQGPLTAALGEGEGALQIERRVGGATFRDRDGRTNAEPRGLRVPGREPADQPRARVEDLGGGLELAGRQVKAGALQPERDGVAVTRSSGRDELFGFVEVTERERVVSPRGRDVGEDRHR